MSDSSSRSPGSWYDLRTGKWVEPVEGDDPLPDTNPGRVDLAQGRRRVEMLFIGNTFGSGPRSIKVGLRKDSLGIGERGLVIGPPMELVGESDLRVTGLHPEPQELRFAALFWDRLIIPRSNIIDFSASEDMQFLQSEGLLQDAMVQLEGGWTAGDGLRESYLSVFRRLRDRDGERWSFARGESSASIIPARETTDQGITFDLHRVLPIPDQEVPLAEVIEFRNRRRAELVALRTRLDEVLSAIVSDPRPELAKRREMDPLAQAIQDYIRVSREPKFPLRLTGLKARLDYKTLIGMGSSFTAAARYGLPDTIAALVGLGGGLLASINSELVWAGRTPGSSAYEYVSRYHRDLFM